MKIKIGMPEILIIFALVIYSQSFTFSIVSFSLGILSRLFDYILDYGAELKKSEAINQSVDDIGNAFKDLFGGSKE